MASVLSVPVDVLSPEASVTDLPSMGNKMGVIVICACIGCILFGLTTHQSYIYFRLYPSDGLRLKSFVLTLCVLDTFHTVLSVHICYFYLVSNYFDPHRLLDGVWSIRLTIVVTGCIIALAHCFYTRRVLLLGAGKLWPIAFIGVLLVTEFGEDEPSTTMPLKLMVLAFNLPFRNVHRFRMSSYHDFEHSTVRQYLAALQTCATDAAPVIQWLICSALGVAVIVDIFITISLTMYLRRSRTGFKKTDSLVDILLGYVINTGLSTSIITLVAAITAVALKDSHVYSGLYIIASKMYSVSLMAVYVHSPPVQFASPNRLEHSINSRRSLLDKVMENFEMGSFGLKGDDGPPSLNIPSIPLKAPATSRVDTLQSVIDVRVAKETNYSREALPGRDAGGNNWDGASDSDSGKLKRAREQ
ncbi:hypothetical protein VTO73DRAFT_8591 [Trametes versicolor]